MKKLTVILFILPFVVLTSCKKDSPLSKDETSNLTIHFDNIAGDADLVLNTGNYTDANGESFTITKFDYYISNIILTKIDGTQYVVPQDSSYFLIKESEEATQDVLLNNVPVGDYNKITFTIGVDSLRSTADMSQRTGVLDPGTGGLGMFWVWNTGYIFLKLEGTSPAAPMDGNIQYHIGGFGGTMPNNIRTVSLDFPAGVSAKVRGGKYPEAHLLADALKVLNGATNIKIADDPMVMSGDKTTKIADNYKNMFTVDHVHNN